MFSTNFSKICCSFAQNKIFEKSKMADMLWNDCCHSNSSSSKLDCCYGKLLAKPKLCMPKLDFYVQPYGKSMGERGGGPTTDILLRWNVFHNEYSVILCEIWQMHGLVDDGVAFVWSRWVWIFVLCCDLAKFENIIMTFDFLFFVGLPWPSKGHYLCKWFFIPRFYFFNIRNIRGKKRNFLFF